MTNLISMTDFVLEQYKKWENDTNPDCQSSGRYILGTHIYANFLKEYLQLWMFIPCKLIDGVWSVMQSPEEKEKWFRKTYDNGWWNDFVEYKKEYQKEKEKCLFDGFEIGVKPLENFILHKSGWGIPIRDIGANLIELYANERYNIELTQTAQKLFE